MFQPLWWKKTVVYQVYPRSFYDSTGNGIGDLQGIIQKLDYVKDLGVETIWFAPFYDSPQCDFGYDIRNYRDIATEYGTMNDCDQLIKEMHDRGMKIVLDMVLNHTSDQHPWFVESKSSRDNPKRDWYVWRDGKKSHGKKPPTNWKSVVRGSGWHYDEHTDQWYWSQFLPFQPDLNYWNPEVQTEMLDTVRFWLDKGVDGFRLDVIDGLFEDAQFRNNPKSLRFLPSEKSPDHLFTSTKYTRHLPESLQFMKKLRTVIDEYSPSRFMVGEVNGPLHLLKEICGEEVNDRLNLVFLFKSLRTAFNSSKIKELVQSYEKFFPEPFMPTWVFGNHDQARRISKFDGNIEMAKLNAAFQLTVRGVPFIYYGEEIGMETHNLEIRKSLDPIGQKFRDFPKFLLTFSRNHLFLLNRDECRTPMQWNTDLHSGFCGELATPWLPVTLSFKERNVKSQLEDPDSLLHCYKRLLKLRRESPALHSGNIMIDEDPDTHYSVLKMVRIFNSQSKKQTAMIYLNMSKKKVHFKNPDIDANFSLSTTIKSENNDQTSSIKLKPWEGVVYIKND